MYACVHACMPMAREAEATHSYRLSSDDLEDAPHMRQHEPQDHTNIDT